MILISLLALSPVEKQTIKKKKINVEKIFHFFLFLSFYEKKSLKNLKKFELPNGVKIDSIHIELSQKFNSQILQIEVVQCVQWTSLRDKSKRLKIKQYI